MTSMRTEWAPAKSWASAFRRSSCRCHVRQPVAPSCEFTGDLRPDADYVPVTTAVVFPLGVGSAMGYSVGDR